MKCVVCYEDIDSKGQDNVSPIPNCPICEDCIDKIIIDCMEPSEPCKSCSRAEWVDMYGALVYACDMSHCIMAESDYD